MYFADDDNTYSLQIFEEVGDKSVRLLPRDRDSVLQPARKQPFFPCLVPDEEHPAGLSVAGGAGRRDEIREARGRGREGLYFVYTVDMSDLC